jgi:uncharacterized phage-associated protein
MYSALVIASRLINKAIENGKPITPMKLQKMVYFAHGVSLAQFDKQLINEPIMAWTYGPVIPAVYHAFKHWGNSPITERAKFEIQLDDRRISGVDFLDDDTDEVIDFTWEVTKNLTAIQLSEWSHSEGSPWSKSFCGDTSSCEISDSIIKTYFIQIVPMYA